MVLYPRRQSSSNEGSLSRRLLLPCVPADAVLMFNFTCTQFHVPSASFRGQLLLQTTTTHTSTLKPIYDRYISYFCLKERSSFSNLLLFNTNVITFSNLNGKLISKRLKEFGSHYKGKSANGLNRSENQSNIVWRSAALGEMSLKQVINVADN
jgi:hypothetical protein